MDDDPEDTPRILIEYTVIGSKYASNVHSLDQMQNKTMLNGKTY